MKTLITAVSTLGLSGMLPGVLALYDHSPVQRAQAIHANASASQSETDRDSGMITAVSTDALTFELRTPDGIVKIRVDDSTEFSVNGVRTDRTNALKVGREAVAHHTGGHASRVEVSTEIEPPPPTDPWTF